MELAFASRLFLCLFVSVVANVTLVLLLLASAQPDLAPNPVPAAPEQEPTTISESGVRWDPCAAVGWRHRPGAIGTEVVGASAFSKNSHPTPTKVPGAGHVLARCE
ncbi:MULTISPECIES: hypothetical protein [Nocardioides]|uniref:Secreted protein n=1 Tax=Nocardioides vastitatis TaxID=2568655 RepID=A0ABW0ZLS3_9ACTN|nr:hypothetical protein [Nocardioides sp.]THJ04341.1 hypothetical protein E7Z54_09015 [Nocardioides sp.]